MQAVSCSERSGHYFWYFGPSGAVQTVYFWYFSTLVVLVLVLVVVTTVAKLA